MKTAYIHVGTEKTGSTSIQRFLYANEKLLNRHGFMVCRAGRKTDFKTYAHSPLLTAVRKPAHPDSRQLLDNLAKEVRTTAFDNSILSCEGFSYLEVHSLKRLFVPFRGCMIRVILYLRRQDDFIESWFQQDVKGGVERGYSLEAFIDKYRYKMDFKAILSRFEAALGTAGEIIIRPFECSQLYGGDVVKDFVELLGISHSDNWQIDWPRLLDSIPTQLLLFKLMINRMEVIPEKEKRTGGGFYRSAIALHEMNFCNPRDEQVGRVFPLALKHRLLMEYEGANRDVATKYLGRKNGRLFYEGTGYKDMPEEGLPELDPKDAIPMLLLTIENLRRQVTEHNILFKRISKLISLFPAMKRWLGF
ncbi:MAG: hypothetical protein SWQ30_02975 [Thermodesulfobacteriota bacterium]|nr:hypothetical protein [Thermodesulfobacteriota bacterium]